MDEQNFEPLLDYLRLRRGCDLTIYKYSCLSRRIQYRMMMRGIKSYEEYLNYLKADSEELILLSKAILINVTSFFRDRLAWEYIAQQIIPQIIANKRSHESIRIWSAGCSSGQEVYSMAMLLAEALGIEQYLQRVQFFATDISKESIRRSRQAKYSVKEVENIPSHLLAKYFELSEDMYVFHPNLARKTIFGHHNLAKNAPMSKIDLLVCRNVLIYLNSDAKAKILAKFHFALNTQGFLFLGNAETLIARKNLFTPVNSKQRIFSKQSQAYKTANIYKSAEVERIQVPT